jgi:hypothetical protein
MVTWYAHNNVSLAHHIEYTHNNNNRQ